LRKPATTGSQEWQSGWAMVLACFVGFSYFSVTTAALGVFMEPIGREFGWGRALLSAGMTISAVVTAVLSPFFGILIDRYGARRLALPGLVATSFAIAGLSQANGSAVQWLALWGFYAVISITVKTTVWTAAVSGVFNSARGLALGLTLSGTAAAQVIAPPLFTWLIAEYGWRLAYIAMGFGWGGIALLLAWLFLYDAHDRKRAAAVQNTAQAPPPATELQGLTVNQAWRSAALWRIAAATFLLMLLGIGLQIHQVPILTEAGVSRSNAAWLASLAGAAGIAGKLVTGALLDRFRANWIGGLTLGANALAFALLIYGTGSPTLIVLAMAVNGYSAGTKLHIATYLTSRYGGMRNFGKIYGVMTSLVALGSGLGPLLAGLAYDVSGNYGAFLLAGTIGCAVCGWLIFSLPGYPDWEASTTPTTGARGLAR
jgi:predicted MFS family arabinose efflux permease